MPYIQKDKRNAYAPLINNAISAIAVNNKPPLRKAELFGYFVHRLCEHYLYAQPSVTAFNSHMFEAGIKKQIEDIATKIIPLLNREDLIGSAGNLNYAISAVWWGICGDHSQTPSASYGFRCVTRGVLEQLVESFDTFQFEKNPTGGANQKITLIRRVFTVKGVLNDVISECYRRKTVPYEDAKIAENGDVWDENGLVIDSDDQPLAIT